MVDTLTIFSKRVKVPAKGVVSSNFWVSIGFGSIRGIANADKVGPESLVRIIQGINPEKRDRQRAIKLFDPNCDIKLIEPVCSQLVRVDYENDLDEEVNLSLDVALSKRRVERDEVKYRDFFNETRTVLAGSTFAQNEVNIQEALGRSVTSLHIQLPTSTDLVNLKINDEGTNLFEVIGERRFTPEADQLEICRVFIENPGAGNLDVRIFAT